MKGKIADFANSFFLKKLCLKGIFVILDGLGDVSHTLLENKTPLEAADTPNMDFLATRGEMGCMYPIKPSFVPESDEALVSIFGNDLILNLRGQLEAKGADISLSRGDLAIRANFATIDSLEKGNVIDRRVGRTLSAEDVEVLAKAVGRIKLPCKFVFEPTMQHRAVLILRGGFSDNILGNDRTYVQGKTQSITKIQVCKALDDEENSQYTVNILNEFIKKACEVLDKHPVNEERKKKGLLPANYILIRQGGIEVPKLKQYKKWVSISYMPLEKGFSKAGGMKIFSFDYPQLEDLDAYENLWEGLRKACKFAVKSIKNLKDFNYVYVHISEIDFPGHDNKPIEKKMMLEYVDKTLFKFLRSFAPPNKVKVLVTGTNSTPCRLKEHSADSVPVLLYNGSLPKEKHFNEKEARKGILGRIMGKDLLKKVGFDK